MLGKIHMEHKLKFVSVATAFISYTQVGIANSQIVSVKPDKLDCVFGKLDTLAIKRVMRPNEEANVAAIAQEIQKGASIVPIVCADSGYENLPVGARQVFDRQVVIYNICIKAMAGFARISDFNAYLRSFRKANSVGVSLSDILKYGKVRQEVIETNKKGTEQILAATGPLLGIPGKIGKVFEATEGALKFGELAKDIAEDVAIDKAIKEPAFDKISEAVAERIAEKADEAFSARMKEIAEAGGCQ